MNIAVLPPWDGMLKQMVWQQLGDLQNRKMLDFGSGTGVTSCYYAKNNDVLAIEPSEEAVGKRWQEHSYQQLVGSTDRLRELPSSSFDVILCHNVLEYAADRDEIVRQFNRLMKPDGLLSIVKHNRPGRVMQMAVLLNDFEKAHVLLDGLDGASSQYGSIHYYEDADIENWCPELKIEKTLGMRTFWDLQQNQECHKDAEWQKQMLKLEHRVSEIEAYREIAFFHHLLIRKQ